MGRETEVVRALCDYLAVKKYFFWRQNNTGVARMDRKTGRRFWTSPKNSRKGVPDIFVMGTQIGYAAICVYPPQTATYPKMIAIEAKSETGTLSDDQKEFRKEWEARGGVYIVARSVNDIIRAGL